MSEEHAGYTFLRWNGKYGSESKFVVRDNSTGKQSMFTPGKTEDVVWTTVKLDESPEIKKWEDFGSETVENLDIVS